MKPHYENPQKNVATFKAMFEGSNIDWAVIGGIAAICRGTDKRETVDADFVVSELGNLEEQLTLLGPKWFKVTREPDGTPYLIQGETGDGMHFDIYVQGIDFELEVLATKDDNHIASAEAIIVYKLMAMRPQDISDIESILKAHPNFEGLDIEFINKWAAECSVSEQWAEFVNRSKLRSKVSRQG